LFEPDQVATAFVNRVQTGYNIMVLFFTGTVTTGAISFLFFTFYFVRKFDFSGDQIEKNEIGGACTTYGGKERRIQDFGGET
jgi:hypothetical protein